MSCVAGFHSGRVNQKETGAAGHDILGRRGGPRVCLIGNVGCVVGCDIPRIEFGNRDCLHCD